MARGRRTAKREAAETRASDARERVAREQQVLRRWGTPRGALDRLGVVSRELERLHRDEAKLLRERDELVAAMRSAGEGWNSLSARTKLSRQALMKRLHN